MAVPVSQMYTVTKYVLTQKLRGVKRYPLVLMLEPLFRCNLACAGCGKIQYPDHVLDKRLTPAQCWAAADECAAPIISIPGGEPLIHPEMPEIVRGLVEAHGGKVKLESTLGKGTTFTCSFPRERLTAPQPVPIRLATVI